MKECQLCKTCYSDSVTTCPQDGMPVVHTIAGEPVLEEKYQLEKRLGQGGMGVVYKAVHKYLRTQHAIKVILPDLVGNDPQLVTRFRQEALAAAAIRHQNVVAVTDYGVAAGTMPFLVMEYVEGESLHDVMVREGKLSIQRAIELISPICAGVGAAHRQGIVHRDLKPLNVMIVRGHGEGHTVKILDFGLAKIKSGELLGSFVQAQTTGLMGSPYYMAPEQWSEEEPDARSDVYSLGVLLYQMLAGDVPFKGSSIPAIMKKHLYDPPPPLSDFGVAIDPGVEAVVRKALEKDVHKRTSSVEMLMYELQNAVGMQTVGNMSVAGVTQQIASLLVKTNPPNAEVYVDNKSVGRSLENGNLMLEGIQSGHHLLRVAHPGFDEWHQSLFLDSGNHEVVADLTVTGGASRTAIPRPDMPQTNPEPATQMFTPNVANTQSGQAANATVFDPNLSIPEAKKRSLALPIFGVIGILGLLVLTVIGVVGAYFLGLFPGLSANVATNVSKNTNTATVDTSKDKFIEISGGTFKMGRNDGDIKEKPEHSVTVKPFSIARTEVTNGEYLEFVNATQRLAPSHWVSGKPIAGTEKMPVRFVSFDDAEAYAKWLSEKDGKKYRLPSEEEWEFTARNGSKGDLYPWGTSWMDDAAVIGTADSEPTTVCSKEKGNNAAGVCDLIGNVWEWTTSEIAPYPGSDAVVKKPQEKRLVVRGGSAHEKPSQIKITSTFRADVAATQKEKNLGFRIVRENP